MWWWRGGGGGGGGGKGIEEGDTWFVDGDEDGRLVLTLELYVFTMEVLLLTLLFASLITKLGLLGPFIMLGVFETLFIALRGVLLTVLLLMIFEVNSLRTGGVSVTFTWLTGFASGFVSFFSLSSSLEMSLKFSLLTNIFL